MTADSPDPAVAPTPRRRRWWSVSVRGLMVLVLIVGGLVGWYVHRTRVRREALAIVEAANSRVEFQDEFGGAEDGWWSRLWAWLYEQTGDDAWREVAWVILVKDAESEGGPKRRPSFDRACAAIGRLGPIGMVYLRELPPNAEGLAHLVDAPIHTLDLTDIPEMSASILAQVRRLRRIESLAIETDAAAAPAATLRAVGDLTQLRSLSLQGFANPEGDDLAALGRLANLEWLNLPQSPVADSCLAHLEALQHLATLYFPETEVTDAALSRLATRLPQLTTIDLDGRFLTDRGIEALTQRTDFEALDLATVEAPTVAG